MKLIDFTSKDNPELLAAYLSLKYEVFVAGMSWDTLPHSKSRKIVLKDDFDDIGRFAAILTDAGAMAGVVRGIIPSRSCDLYRKELYEEFLESDCVRCLDGRIATVNSLAVHPIFRGRAARAGRAEEFRLPLSEILMQRIVALLQAQGAALILLSAIDGPSHSIISRVGFKHIGPVRYFTGKDYSLSSTARTLGIYDMALPIKPKPELMERRNTAPNSLPVYQQRNFEELQSYIDEKQTFYSPD